MKEHKQDRGERLDIKVARLINPQIQNNLQKLDTIVDPHANQGPT